MNALSDAVRSQRTPLPKRPFTWTFDKYSIGFTGSPAFIDPNPCAEVGDK